MYQAAIVEDEKEIGQYLQKTLVKAFADRSVSIEFDNYTDGEKLISTLSGHYHYDVIFLDIEMPGVDGITLCRRIREIMPEVLVVFISNKEELVFQTFEVQPFRFIRKSEYDSQLNQLTDAIVKKLNESNPQILKLREGGSGDVFSFDLKSVLYIEAQRKSCRIVTSQGEQSVRCKLMEMEEYLPDGMFIKPHRSYLVNCKYICLIGKSSITLTNGEEIALSRNKIHEVKQQFLDYTIW